MGLLTLRHMGSSSTDMMATRRASGPAALLCLPSSSSETASHDLDPGAEPYPRATGQTIVLLSLCAADHRGND